MLRNKKSRNGFISIIIPAFKQEKTIRKDILHIKNVMEQIGCKYELIVVVDGFVDKTFQNAKKVESSKILIIGYENNHGKGHAVRYGMMHAKGDIVAFIDSGRDINPKGISMLLEHLKWYNADIIVGSKLHPVSKVNYPFERWILSWGYRTIVRILFGLSIRDTQVGIKFYKRKVLDDVLPRLLVENYAFDIEILAVAYHLGYKRIYEAPIELDFQSISSIASFVSVSFWRTILYMLKDTLAIFFRLKIQRFYDDTNKRR